MTLHGRLAVLERVLASSRIERCFECGFPHPAGRPLLIVDLEPGDAAGEERCPECDRLLDERGVPVGEVWPDGQVHAVVLTIVHSKPAVELEERP